MSLGIAIDPSGQVTALAARLASERTFGDGPALSTIPQRHICPIGAPWGVPDRALCVRGVGH